MRTFIMRNQNKSYDRTKYFQEKVKLGTMWDDVMKILNDAIGVNLSFGYNV